MESIKEYYPIVILTIIAIIAIFGVVHFDSADKENTINDFRTIVVNGEEYDTHDIKKVETGGYAGAVVITLKDGTEIHTTSYTLKN